jgi:broad specificity phosphatase PhoE
MDSKKKKIFLKVFITLSFLIILLSSLLNIYSYRDSLKNRIKKTVQNNFIEKENVYRSKRYSEYDFNKEHRYWVNQISKGGYILFFRHAEREKWPIVMAYDAYELSEKLSAENTSISKAVCLSDRGIEQAKLMGFYIKLSKMYISEIISSPSCRARMTAKLAFGGIDKISRNLIHYGPWNETRKEHLDEVRNILENIEIKKNHNVIISAHNGVIQKYLFDKIEDETKDFNIEEGGFYIIAKEKNKIILKKKINSFYYFSRYLIKRN